MRVPSFSSLYLNELEKRIILISTSFRTCQHKVSFLIIKHRYLIPIMCAILITPLYRTSRTQKYVNMQKNIFSSKFACDDCFCMMYPFFLHYFHEQINLNLFTCARLGYPLTCFMFSQFHIINCPKNNTSLLLFSELQSRSLR